MRALIINCAEEGWKALLKRNLQDGIQVTLDNLDYAIDGQFCEILAISHSMTLKLDVRNKAGLFRKHAPGS
jgi:hypothetical protein